MKRIVVDKTIGTNYLGYNSLILLYHQICSYKGEKIELDFSNNRWFEANLCALLGSIIFLVKKDMITVEFIGMSKSLIKILERNGFLNSNSCYQINNTDTVVSFKRFSNAQDAAFNEYIMRELISKSNFPKHSNKLGKKISESIFEIFENAKTHGRCEYIYTCGQHYPKKIPARLDITIVDIGQTIHKNVNDFFPYLPFNITATESIVWAVEYGHTTKKGRTGGLGLSLIKEFLELNKGVLQIISSNGFWEYKNGIVNKKDLAKHFPGTIVNIEFNFDDISYYQLNSEIDIDLNNIF